MKKIILNNIYYTLCWEGGDVIEIERHPDESGANGTPGPCY